MIKRGLIATGDSFISEESEINRLKVELPNLDAIEMEGEQLLKSQNKKEFLG